MFLIQSDKVEFCSIAGGECSAIAVNPAEDAALVRMVTGYKYLTVVKDYMVEIDCSVSAVGRCGFKIRVEGYSAVVYGEMLDTAVEACSLSMP